MKKLLFIGLIALALLGVAVLSTPVSAQGTVAQDVTVNVPAGQTVRLPVELWCLEFGKPFPQSVSGPADLAPAKVISVLQSAYSGNQATSDAYQTQLAVWYAVDGTWHDNGTGHAVAQQIVNNAQNNTSSAATATSTATANSNVTVTVENLTAVPDKAGGAPPYHGTATLVITNNSQQAATYTFLQGSTFKPNSASDQTLIGVSSGAQTAQATTTTAATETATTAATTAPTVAAAATNTPAPTNTVAPTVEATTTVESTPVASAVATETATPSALPTTGASTGGSGIMWIALALGGLMLLGGLAMSAKSRSNR